MSSLVSVDDPTREKSRVFIAGLLEVAAFGIDLELAPATAASAAAAACTSAAERRRSGTFLGRSRDAELSLESSLSLELLFSPGLLNFVTVTPVAVLDGSKLPPLTNLIFL